MLAAMPPPATSPTSPGPTGEAHARTRGDACPGSLRLHGADDGALARVRVPGGVLGAAQARALGDAAGRLGDGDIRLTSRGNAELRGLAADCGAELAQLLGAAGLLPSVRHERVRNVVASPLSGLDGLGHGDVGPWLRGLDTLLCAGERTTRLSGRFLFALDDGRGDVDALGADVTLRAEPGGGALLRVGTARDAVRLPGAQAVRAALVAAETFLDGVREVGVWRVSEFPGGPDALLADVVRELRAARLDATRTKAPARPATPAPPRLGVVTDTAPATDAAPSTDAAPADGPDRPARAALSVGAPLGRLAAGPWRLLTDVARRHGDGTLRLTPWRGVVLPGVLPAQAEELLGLLDGAGLITREDSPWRGVGACVGRPGCAKSLADVQSQATLALGPVGGLPVHWSGCARRCGHPHGEWVDVLATEEGHRITVVRGEARDTPVTVPDGSPALSDAVAAARGKHA
ncbi:precorrin-3B synthase [Streptomyces sp. NPDC004111]|uniref:precorrin-3B synthase n=1 Tax=Streptomyces sp. NPDC004111 TaxID=3364690 RepID=UPI00367B7DB0